MYSRYRNIDMRKLEPHLRFKGLFRAAVNLVSWVAAVVA